MAVSKFIQAVRDEAKGRPRSTQWYKDKIKEFGQPGALDLIRDGKRDTKPFYGKLNMFFYDPKHKKKLPYYDTFPLVLPIEKYPDGFLGINMHYLPLPLRAKLMDALYSLASNQRYDEATKIKLSYNILNSSSKYKKAVTLNIPVIDYWDNTSNILNGNF